MKTWLFIIPMYWSLATYSQYKNTIISDDAISEIKSVSKLSESSEVAQAPFRLSCRAQDIYTLNVFITGVNTLNPENQTTDIQGFYYVSTINPDSLILEFGNASRREALKFSRQELVELSQKTRTNLKAILVRGYKSLEKDQYTYEVVTCK